MVEEWQVMVGAKRIALAAQKNRCIGEVAVAS